MSRQVAVTGAGGFIGGHLVASLLRDGFEVMALDCKPVAEWWQVFDTRNFTADLNDLEATQRALKGCVEVFHLAADMGGIGYIVRNDLACALSVSLTTNLIQAALTGDVERIVYASSACIYPKRLQGASPTALAESMAMPADPEGGYGWSKLFAEQAFTYLSQTSGITVGLARLFNVYGPHGEFRGGREKAPAAICRKVAEAMETRRHSIELWGNGAQRRSYLFVTDCVEALRSLMSSRVNGPINIASEEVVTALQLAESISALAGLELQFTFDLGAPVGVEARIPDITLARTALGWSPRVSLSQGLETTYQWIRNSMLGGKVLGH